MTEGDQLIFLVVVDSAVASDDPGAGEPENRGGRLPGYNLYNDIQVTTWDYIYAPGRLARPGQYLHPLPVFNDRTQPPHSNMYTTLGRNTGTLRLSVIAESENRITVVVKE